MRRSHESVGLRHRGAHRHQGSVELIEPALKRRGSVAEAGSGGTYMRFSCDYRKAERPDGIAKATYISYG